MKNSKKGPKIFAMFVLLAMMLPLLFGLVQGYETYKITSSQPDNEEIIESGNIEEPPFDMYREPEDSYEDIDIDINEE